MKTASIYEAKTNFSKYIANIISKQDPYVVIVKNGKPVARLVPFESEAKTRIGMGKNLIPNIKSLDDFNGINPEIETEFSGDGGLL